MPLNQDKKWLLGLMIASLILWLISLGNSPLRDWDEGTIAQVAREIWQASPESMGWLYPTLGGEAYQNKPPLIHWLIAGAYSLGGVNEWSARLPGAILTALGVPLLYLLGREIFNQTLPALFSALVYMTLLPVVRHGRLAMLDGAIITFFLLLLFCLFRARQQKIFALGVGICLGLITLIKGMIVLLLAGIVSLFILIDKRLDLLKNPHLWIGLIIGISLPLAWYLAQLQHYGDNFFTVNFQIQTFARLTESVEGNSGPPWFYLLEILKYGFPWLLFWPGGIYLAVKKRRTTWGCLILVGTIIYFGTVSAMQTKLPWYVMPLYPFLALAIGAKLNDIWQNRHFQVKAWAGFLAVIALAGLGGCVYFGVVNTQLILIVMSIVLTVTMSVGAWLIIQRDRLFIPVLFSGMYLVLLLFVSSQSWIWELNEAFAVKPVASLILQHLPARTKIYTSFTYSRPSLNFYCDCQVIPATATDLPKLWSNQSYLLLENQILEQINLPNSQILGTAGRFTLIAPIK
ncbi:MAG TPA: glycosyltransferase family 39 protein [Nostocaceae cyanobacterium]|nr:glycosyltransferase family 39 protein [Nostocaceae cyanobacterium]